MWNEWGELSRVKNELNKLSGLIVGSNILQSPLDFWGWYDAWREAVKGLDIAIREMEEKMERLTHERVNGIKTRYWSPEKKETLVNALAEYENTGLTPEEIKMLNGKGADAPANDGWIPVEKYGLPKEEGIYDLTIINGRGEYVSVRWEFLSGVHLSGQQHYVDGVHYWADNYRGEPINEFLSERVIAWRKKPEPYRPERSKE